MDKKVSGCNFNTGFFPFSDINDHWHGVFDMESFHMEFLFLNFTLKKQWKILPIQTLTNKKHQHLLIGKQKAQATDIMDKIS